MNLKQGSLLLAGAWAVLMVAGYGLTFWLTRVFDQSLYGDYIIVVSILLWLEIVVLNGIPYTIQKFIGAEPHRVSAIFKTALRLQGMVTFGLFIIAFFCAPFIAKLFQAPRYTLLLRVAFLDIPVYGFYHLYVGYKNGLQKFGQQSLVIIVYGLSRLMFGVLLVLITKSIIMALVANIAASLAALIAGILCFEKHPRLPTYPAGAMIRFVLPSLSFQLLLNLLFYVDLWIIKYHYPSPVSAEYGIAGYLSRVPFFLFLGVSVSLLPALSQAFKEEQFERAKKLTAQAIHFLWMLIVPVGLMTTLFATEIVGFLFPNEYLQAGPVISILVWGMIAVTFVMFVSTILNADHKPHIALGIMAVVVMSDIVMNLIFVPAYGSRGGAMATTISCGVGSIVFMAYMIRQYKICLPWRSLGRMLLIAAGVSVAVDATGLQGVWVIPGLLVGMAAYLGLLLWTRDLTMEEVKGVFGIKKV